MFAGPPSPAPRIVVIDHRIPTSDRDAGSRTAWQYLELLVGAGFRVTFTALQLQRPEPYTGDLRRLGVQVLVGIQWRLLWPLWLLIYGREVRYVVIHRPHIAARYLPWVRRCTRAKVIFVGHDLHFVREERMRAARAAAPPASGIDWRQTELRVIQSVDVAYYPSNVEVELLRDLAPGAVVRRLPYWFWRDGLPRLSESPPPEARLLFVGSFDHSPNLDGLQWFLAEIYPQLREWCNQVRFSIVGASPPAALVAVCDDSVDFRGYLSDPDLVALYRQSRVAVIPLRYGAGVKGKLVEALHLGVPVVTTGIGAEGLPDLGATVVIADSAAEFADAIFCLLQDDLRWQQSADAGQAYAGQHFSQAAAIRELASVISELQGSQTQ